MWKLYTVHPRVGINKCTPHTANKGSGIRRQTWGFSSYLTGSETQNTPHTHTLLQVWPRGPFWTWLAPSLVCSCCLWSLHEGTLLVPHSSPPLVIAGLQSGFSARFCICSEFPLGAISGPQMAPCLPLHGQSAASLDTLWA